MMREIWRGALAGAAGTAALNATTYLDMTLRGRPASGTPEKSVERLSETTGVPVPGDEQAHANRLSGLGALSGIATGVTVGAAYGLLRSVGVRLPVWAGALVAGGGAMLAANAPMAAAGVSHPSEWSGTDWLADAVPHAAYGAVTAATFAATDR